MGKSVNFFIYELKINKFIKKIRLGPLEIVSKHTWVIEVMPPADSSSSPSPLIFDCKHNDFYFQLLTSPNVQYTPLNFANKYYTLIKPNKDGDLSPFLHVRPINWRGLRVGWIFTTTHCLSSLSSVERFLENIFFRCCCLEISFRRFSVFGTRRT